ncbi:MAG: DUF11 domain-containing protein [Planctomycetes bacterium]|nr:DUF11 domain-containing protein [Planctomycetota bacterium]
MKRFQWWTLMALPAAGLAALLLGQAVFGQPEAKQKPSAPLDVPAAPKSGVLPSLPEPPRLPEAPAPKPIAEPAGPTEISKPMEAVLPLPGLSEPLPKKDGGRVPEISEPTVPDMLPRPKSISPPVATLVTPEQAPGSIIVDAQPGKQQAAVSVEWVGPAAMRVNQPMTCQLIVRNTSATPAQNVVVRHRLGKGVVCKSSEPLALQGAGELTWNLGTLGPKHVRRIDLTLVAQTRGTLDLPAIVTFSSVAAHRVQVNEPQLLVKVQAPDKVIVGENVTLYIAIGNPGDGAAEGVKVKAILPDGFEHPRGKFVEFDAGTLEPKDARAVELVCVAKAGGAQKCVVIANGAGGLSHMATSQVDVLVPKLNVAIAGPKLRYLERRAIYTLKVKNPGSAPATNVEVQETIPAGFKFQLASHSGTYQAATRQITWTLGDLAPGQSKDLAVELIPVEAGSHRIAAQAKAARGLSSETDTFTTVEGLPSLFIEVGHVDDPIEVGAETAYEIRVANTGTKTETNVEVVCTLPDQLAFKAAKCSSTLRYKQEGRDLIFEPLPRLAPKADVVFRIQVRGVAPGDVRFRTRIRADGLKSPIVREENLRVYVDDAPVRPAKGNSNVRREAPIVEVETPSKKAASAPLPLPAPPRAIEANPGSLPMIALPTPPTNR